MMPLGIAVSVSPKVTVREVASRAGVSASTAAAALRGAAWVRPETRSRIETAAAELGYRRDPAASILAAKRGQSGQKARLVSIGVLHEPTVPGRTAYTGKAGLDAAVAQRGWVVHAANLEEINDLNRLARRWEDMGIDAVVLVRTKVPLTRIDFPWHRFTVLSTEVGRLREGFDVVRPSQFGAITECLRETKCRGYRRFGFWLRVHPEPLPDDHVRCGACKAFQELELRGEKKLPMLLTPFGEHQERLRRWLEKHQPEVVVTFWGIDVRDIEAVGWRVPDDIAMVCLQVSSVMEGRVAGLMDREQPVGEAVCNFIERKLTMSRRGLSDHPLEVVYDLPFVDGTSLPRVG